MEILCPLDTKFAKEISALLKPPNLQDTQDYFDKLVAERNCLGLKVKVDANLAKGVYADAEFKEGELVLKDQMLMGSQHLINKIDCFVCSFCYQFIGSIEIQIGRKLICKRMGLSPSNHCHSDSTDEEDEPRDTGAGECTTSGLKDLVPLSEEVTQSLVDGQLKLPYTDKFPLPPVIPCPGGCEEEHYCSESCAESDWKTCHSLLCVGKKSKKSRRVALSKFIEHANETNDIFILAAKAISQTIMRYKNLREASLKNGSTASNSDADLSLLLEAWKPISMGYKKRWWDCIALPEDVDQSDEGEFRMQIKQMAFESLQLLKAAIYHEECAPLFSLEIYGHIIGMFELNNLDLVVPTPVEDYFLFIDDLPGSQKKEVESVTQPILDALDEDYSTCCQGSAFFPLQSCMNHSCRPNAKAYKREEDKDGHAIILALSPIRKGEEITISYIDEELPYEERQLSLADYGFRCKCSKCLEEE